MTFISLHTRALFPLDGVDFGKGFAKRDSFHKLFNTVNSMSKLTVQSILVYSRTKELHLCIYIFETQKFMEIISLVVIFIYLYSVLIDGPNLL